MYLSRQLYEEALHVQFYLTLLDSYIPDMKEREEAFAAIHNIPSIKHKGDFCFKWMGTMESLDELTNEDEQRTFLRNLICFAACIEGLFFFAAFAYVYFLRDKGLLNGLAAGTNWVFRDESAHMNFAFEVVRTVRNEQPELWTADLIEDIKEMLREAVDCEMKFADDVLGGGITGMSLSDTREYLQFVADSRLQQLGIEPIYGSKNPFDFMALQDVQELTNFFEKTVIASGAFSKNLTDQLGENIPLDTERGYHVHFKDMEHLISRPVIFLDRGFGMTPMNQGLRAVGTVELGGLKNPPSKKRIDYIVKCAKELLPQLKTHEDEWLGFRPTLPDFLPILGPSLKNENIIYAFGHHHLGWTLGAITGKIISGIVAGEKTNLDLAPYSSKRFD